MDTGKTGSPHETPARRRAFGRFFLIGLALLLAGALIGAKTNRTVEAETFVLKDSKGRKRAQLGDTAMGMACLIYDVNGKVKVRIAFNDDGTLGLKVLDEGPAAPAPQPK